MGFSHIRRKTGPSASFPQPTSRRLIRRELIPLLMKCSTTGYDFETETLLLACRHGYRIAFVPIRTIYRNETSKIRPVRDTIRYFRLMARYLFG